MTPNERHSHRSFSKTSSKRRMECPFHEDDFRCPVCRDIFKNPVLLRCSHSVCKECVQTYWMTKLSRECPVCRKLSYSGDVPLNLALKNLCESFLERRTRRSSGSETVCSLHGEKLKLFCLDDQQPVCLVCRDSAKHTDHKFSPIDEAAKDCKEELQTALKPLKEKLKIFEDYKLNWTQTADHMKIQAHNTEQQISVQFEQIHQFLRCEEAARITALREEEEQKSQMMKEKMEKLNSKLSPLSDTVRAIEEEMRAEDVLFLKNYKVTVERAQCTLQHPEELLGALIHVAKHLTDLKFTVLEKMQEIVQYTPLTLDPNTIHPELIVSDDLSTVRRSDRQTTRSQWKEPSAHCRIQRRFREH